MKRIIVIAWLATLGCSSAPSPSSGRALAIIEPELLENIALSMQLAPEPSHTNSFNLTGLKIYPYGFMSDPPYYDMILKVNERTVVRSYLDFSGQITKTNIIALSEADFWRPVTMISRYYVEYNKLPNGIAYLDALGNQLAHGKATKKR